MSKNIRLCCSITLGMLCLNGLAMGGSAWQTVFQTDFSNDAGWQTNNSNNYYLDSLADPGPTGAYFSRQVDGSNEYSYHLLPGMQHGVPWRLEYDFLLQDVHYPGQLMLSLMDDDMNIFGYGNHTQVSLETGAALQLHYENGQGGHQYWHSFGSPPVPDTWYHAVVTYDPFTEDLMASVINRETGTLLGSTGLGPDFPGVPLYYTSTLPGSLGPINRVAMSIVGDDYEPDAFGMGFFDNIRVSQAVIPAPGAVVLVGIGASVVSWLRRRKAI